MLFRVHLFRYSRKKYSFIVFLILLICFTFRYIPSSTLVNPFFGIPFIREVSNGESTVVQVHINGIHIKLRKVEFTSQKSECEAYGKLNVYPSLFGFSSCNTYVVDGFQEENRYLIVCNSTGNISSALFVASFPFGALACTLNGGSAMCEPLTPDGAVCGCNHVCDKKSLLNNLPITSAITSNKVMSFSLYGNSTSYICGVLRQVRLAKVFFPDWLARIYVNSSVPSSMIEMLQNEAQVVMIPDTSPILYSGMFWRFLVADDDNVQIYCIRDADAIFTHREAVAVNEWLNSGKAFHSLRDHPFHDIHILGGMWCGRKRLTNLMSQILKFRERSKWYDDQNFVQKHLWPIMSKSVLIHDSFPRWHPDSKISKPFPVQRIGSEFIGIAYRKDYYSDKRSYCSNL